MRLLFAVLLSFGLGSLAYAAEITGPQPTLPTTPLTIQTAKGPARFTVEMATSWPQQEVGLMFRKTLAPNAGMLFDFVTESPQSFWMKNTVLPLDMIFVNARDEIVTIHKNTTPYSEQSYVSTKPAKYVVEVNAGYTDRHTITVGDRISWTRF